LEDEQHSLLCFYCFSAQSELRKTFEKYGRLIEVWKTNSTPCFAFIVFQRKDDADEAIRGLNGQ